MEAVFLFHPRKTHDFEVFRHEVQAAVAGKEGLDSSLLVGSDNSPSACLTVRPSVECRRLRTLPSSNKVFGAETARARSSFRAGSFSRRPVNASFEGGIAIPHLRLNDQKVVSSMTGQYRNRICLGCRFPLLRSATTCRPIYVRRCKHPACRDRE